MRSWLVVPVWLNASRPHGTSGTIDDRRDASERANLVVYVRGAVRETYAYARRTGSSPANSAPALHALENAAALVDLTEADD
uniref:Uncharacterized protein n=1 Tax=Streptomyces sp. NBC_00119 TaxID=2975659 RepID=A0AAU1ULT4_9ACTN